MEQRHKEYIEYYRTRMKKYENNSMYKNSYETEKALFEAISNSADLDDFGRKVEEGNLAVKNAIALIKDQYTARQKQYEEMKEYIRLKAPVKILSIVDEVKKDMELVDKVSLIESEVSTQISIDLFTDVFYSDFLSLENIEVWSEAEIPDEWKSDIQEWIKDEIELGIKSWNDDFVPNARNWDDKWNLNFNLIWEERHRRLIPVPDEVIKKRIEQFKKYRGI